MEENVCVTITINFNGSSQLLVLLHKDICFVNNSFVFVCEYTY